MSVDDIMHWVRSPVVWGSALPIGFFVLLFVVSLKERRLVRPYVPARRRDEPGSLSADNPTPLDYADDMPDPSQVSAYVAHMSAYLAANGFEFGGIYAHAKPRIRILAALWWSRQRDVLALAGSGTVFGMPSKQTWLFTPLRDGRFLVTTDNNDEGDLSGIYVMRRVLNVTMDKLLVAHGKHVGRYAALTKTFTERTAADAIHAIYDGRVERMIASGRARYLDGSRHAWHYTPLGGLLVCVAFVKQLLHAFTQFWRVNRKAIADPNLQPIGTNLIPVGIGGENSPPKNM